MPPEAQSLAAFQTAFAARIRNPRQVPLPPGTPLRRMRVYQDLLFNNLEGFLLACYPVSRRILGLRAWRRLLRQFFTEHRAQSPLFRDIPEAFLRWARERADVVNERHPFLTDLMDYEWLELAVSIDAQEAVADEINPHGDLLAGIPVLHPGARLARYHWPVHRIGPRFKPAAPDTAAHHYLLFRSANDAVRFVLLNPLSAALLAALQEQPTPGAALLERLARQGGFTPSESYLRGGAELLSHLQHQGAILGTRNLSGDSP